MNGNPPTTNAGTWVTGMNASALLSWPQVVATGFVLAILYLMVRPKRGLPLYIAPETDNAAAESSIFH